MGGQESKVLSHQDVVEMVQPHFDKLTDNDKKLFNYAIKTVVQESKKHALESVKVSIVFSNCERKSVQSSDSPTSSLVISRDEEGNYHADWEKRSFPRRARSFLSDSSDFVYDNWGTLLTFCTHLIGIAKVVIPAITRK